MKLTITGNVPSQKNRKIISQNSKTKRPFLRSAPAVKEWQEFAHTELLRQFDGLVVTGYPITIALVFWFDNDRRHDLDNAASAVMDALAYPREFEFVDGKPKGIKGTGVIEDDNVKFVDCLTLQYGGIDKTNPRVEIFLDE